MELNLLIGTTLVCFALWAIFDKKALETSKHHEVCVTISLLSALKIPFWCYVLNKVSPGWHIPPEAIFWGLIATTVYLGWMVTYIIALSKASASYVVGITAAYPIIALLLSVLLLHEHFIPQRLLGCAFVFVGLFVLSKSKNMNQDARELNFKFFTLMTISVIFAGAIGVTCKQGVSFTGPMEFELVKSCWDAIGGMMIYTFFRAQKKEFNFNRPNTIKMCALSTIVVAIGYWAYFSALKMAAASYVVSLTACYPVLMYFFALFFLKEKFCHKIMTGIAFVTLGGIIVQTTQML